jgi:hypothetical protein
MVDSTETMKTMISIHINLDPNFVAPPPKPEALSRCRFILVRHAVTEFNMEFARVVGLHGMHGEEYRTLKIRKDLIDP